VQILSTICFYFLVALTQIGVGHHAEYFTYVRPDMLGEFYKIMWYYSWILVIAYYDWWIIAAPGDGFCMP
jgi:hypothetical protein